MFTTTHVPLLLRKIVLGFGDDDGDTVRLCRATFRVPLLTYELARQIDRVAVAAHCFGADALPLWDVALVHLTPADERYTVALRLAPDMPDETATIMLASIERIRVWRPKPDKRELALEFVTLHELSRGDARDLAALLTVWEAGQTYATFTPSQMPLDLDAAPDAPPAAPALRLLVSDGSGGGD